MTVGTKTKIMPNALRRRILMLSGAYAFAPELASAGPLETVAQWLGFESETLVTDVLVVGAGGAGLAAGLSALEAGVEVVILEKQAAIGGNTLIASGLFNAADPERQKAMGVRDSIDWHFEQTMVSGAGRNDADVVRRFTAEAPVTLRWLERHGIRFLPETVTTWGAEWPRGHKPLLPRGSSYVRMLSEAIFASGGKIMTNAKVERILRDKASGRVTGAIFTDEQGRARRVVARRGVVLAAGGYGANPELLRRFAPDFAELPSDNAPGSTGEVMLEARRIGARLRNLECVQTVPGAKRNRNFQVRLDLDAGRSVLVDGFGRALKDAAGSRLSLSAAILSAPGGGAFVLTDDAAVESYDPVSRKAIYRGLETGDAVRAATPEMLARALGLDPLKLRASLEAHNDMTRSKTDSCARVACKPIVTPPFWGSRVVLNVHSTMGGVTIDPEGAVLDAEGKRIPGLFAAGEIVGNIHGANRIGGNGLSAALTMGRVAGGCAASGGRTATPESSRAP